MAMRTNCSHYYRRSTVDGSTAQGCALGEAPDAPDSCPASCPWFEKRKLSTTGFVYGSLAPSETEPEAVVRSSDDKAVLDDVKALFDSISEDVVKDERQRQAADAKRQQRKTRKRRK